ncbi:MAG: transcription repressor NadR [Clostridiales bacterium]|nr:transcription repressor NadR [Clostridiales bacterium]
MGKNRREQIIQILKSADGPVSGGSLASQLGVSRQVIVQDIALLRANGKQIISTNQGYLLQESTQPERVYKVYHTEEQTEEEMNLIVDLGGTVKDIFVYHKTYGVVRAELNIRSRRQVREHIKMLKSGKSTSLMNVTSGYHYHTVTAESEDVLDQIFDELGAHGFLAALQDYEPINFWESKEDSQAKEPDARQEA